MVLPVFYATTRDSCHHLLSLLDREKIRGCAKGRPRFHDLERLICRPPEVCPWRPWQLRVLILNLRPWVVALYIEVVAFGGHSWVLIPHLRPQALALGLVEVAPAGQSWVLIPANLGS